MLLHPSTLLYPFHTVHPEYTVLISYRFCLESRLEPSGPLLGTIVKQL